MGKRKESKKTKAIQPFVYMLTSLIKKNKQYFGKSKYSHRVLQHNGILAGGATRTKKWAPWEYVVKIHGPRTDQEALQLEWRLQRPFGRPRTTRLPWCVKKRPRGMCKEIASLIHVMTLKRWTKNSPLASEVPLTLEWIKPSFKPSDDDMICPCKRERSSL